MRYRLVVWDFDGTLADSLPISLEIFNRMAAEHGFRPVTDPDLVRTMTVLRFIRAHKIPLFRVPRLVKKFLAHQSTMMSATPLYPELARLLCDIRDTGTQQGIVSFNKERNIRVCLQANEVEHQFQFVVGCGGIFGKKRALRKVLKSNPYKRHEVLYVGDEVRDVVAARKAGVDVAAVSWGFNAPDVLARHRPTFLLTHPGELLDAIRQPKPCLTLV
jgi:phosphoglycolate phosphatase